MLSAEQSAFIETFGFVVLHNASSPDETSEILRNFDDVRDEARKGQEFDGQRRQIVMASGVVGPELPHFALESNPERRHDLQPGHLALVVRRTEPSPHVHSVLRREAEPAGPPRVSPTDIRIQPSPAANGRVYDEDLLASDSARIQGMVKPLLELGFK